MSPLAARVAELGLPPGGFVRPAPDEHRAGGGGDLGERIGRHEVEDPAHGVVGSGDEAVKGHRPVDDDPASRGSRIAQVRPSER
jgi:hypothetical protein